MRYRRLGGVTLRAAANVSRVAYVDRVPRTGVTRSVGILVTDNAVRITVAPRSGYSRTRLTRITKVVAAIVAGTRITAVTETGRVTHGTCLVSIVGTVIYVTVCTTDSDTKRSGKRTCYVSSVAARSRIAVRVTKRTAGSRHIPRRSVTSGRRIVTYIGGAAVTAVVPLGRRHRCVIGYCVGATDKNCTGVTAAVSYVSPLEAGVPGVISVTVSAVLACVKVGPMLGAKRCEVRRVLSTRRYAGSVLPVVALVTVKRRRAAPLGCDRAAAVAVRCCTRSGSAT
jgi:hypothetical protein